jgi:phosphoesterase RecJ-like protein
VGVKISALFIETHKFIRVSLRSRGDVVDVNMFARRYFGGGGHKNAAGGKSFVSLAETVEHFKRAAAEYLAELGELD